MSEAVLIKRTDVPGFLTAELYNNGIIEITWDSSIENIEVKHLKEMQRIVSLLGKEKKMPLLFKPHDFLHLTNDAGKYATSAEGTKYSLAIAVMIDNVAKKLLMNFFVKMNKPIVPTKSFSNKEEAIIWLKDF